MVESSVPSLYMIVLSRFVNASSWVGCITCPVDGRWATVPGQGGSRILGSMSLRSGVVRRELKRELGDEMSAVLDLLAELPCASLLE